MSVESLLTEEQTAQLLGGIPKKTLTEWRYRRIGPRGIRVGRYVRYRPADVEASIAGQAEKPKGAV